MTQRLRVIIADDQPMLRAGFKSLLESAGDIADKARDELTDVRRLQSLAFYYAGWSNCYLAILGPGEPHATEALKSFGWLLGSAGRPASLEKLPTSLLQYEHIGRASIGCALDRSGPAAAG